MIKSILNILLLFSIPISCSGLVYRSIEYHSPCESGLSPGFCVPNWECCGTFNAYGPVYDYDIYGNCSKGAICCIDDITCQECPQGHKEDNETCIDINECEEWPGVCAGHKCFNTNGSYECQCYDGFEMIGDVKACRLINKSLSSEILFSESFKINLIKFNEIEVKTENIKMIYSGAVYPKSIDYSFGGNYMAWTDTSTKTITIAPVNYLHASPIMERIILRNLKHPFRLSIDWIHDLIYWTDLEDRTINVIHIYKPYDYYTVVNNTHRVPHDFKVNVADSCLIWTYVGHNPRIMRSLQDGTNQTVLYSSADKQPYYLAIDIHIKRYFFVDKGEDLFLYSIDFEGRDEMIISSTFRNILSQIVTSPFIYDHEIYLLTSTDLYSIGKFSDNLTFHTKVKSLKTKESARLFDFKIIDPILQPRFKNKCLFSRCSHLCLPSNHSRLFRCLCPSNSILVNYSKCQDNKLANFNIVDNLQVLFNQAINRSLEMRDSFNKSIKQVISYNITNIIQDDRKCQGQIILVLILVLLILLFLILFFGLKFDIFKIKQSKSWSKSQLLYRRSNPDSIEEIDSKT